jgi:hypothetical protein
VRKRGEVMARGELPTGAWSIPAGYPYSPKGSARTVKEELVRVANDNCPGQVVISGAKTAVELQLLEQRRRKRAIALA